METDALNALSAMLSALPPWMAATVILAMCMFGLAYLWRKSGEEAKREKAAKASGLDARLDVILSEVRDNTDMLIEVKSDLAILKDRGKR